MMKPVSNITLALVFCAVGCSNTLPGAAPRTVANHVPSAVNNARMLGRVAAALPLQLDVVLPGQDPEGLAAYLEALYNPQSPLFHAFLTPDAFHVRFDPTDAQVAAARAALAANGVDTDPEVHGTYLVAHTDAATAERVWHTSLSQFETVDGSRFYAPSVNVTMPEALDASAVVGLYEMPVARRAAAVTVQSQNVLDAPALRKALQIPSAANGAGVVVGIYSQGVFNASDIPVYTNEAKIAVTPDIKNILIAGATATGDTSSETALDTDMVVALAPNANIRIYQVPSESANLALMAGFSEMANPTLGDKLLPRVVNFSYSVAEAFWTQADLNSTEPFLQRMASQGQTLYASSGDDADTAAELTPQQVGANYPATSEWVVSVGGTFLQVDSAGNYVGETTWFDHAQQPSGSGGGISTLFVMPPWQQPLFTSASKGSATMRNVPDVAAMGDPNSGVLIVLDGVMTGEAGTSLSAPLWVGFQALVEQVRADAGLEPLGFAAPAIYYVANAPEYASRFHDIADGSSNGTYPAVKGLDDCTGLGSFTPTLLQTLASGYAQHGFSGGGWLMPTGAP